MARVSQLQAMLRMLAWQEEPGVSQNDWCIQLQREFGLDFDFSSRVEFGKACLERAYQGETWKGTTPPADLDAFWKS